MKKIVLLLTAAIICVTANAQYTLSGSSYTQNFDGIGTPPLPTGWYVYSAASSTFIGTPVSCNSSACLPSYPSTDSTCLDEVVTGGFKNYPSADVCHEGDNYCAATPPSYSNRALGVRQVSPTNSTNPNLDSGAAFVFEIANTLGISNLALSFKLQSLDSSSPRVTTWLVDYGIATTSLFTPATATTGTWTTGGETFSNDSVSVSFGSALNDKAGPIYIRIVALDYSSGEGNRASTAIDDYNLTWTGTPTPTTGVANVSAAQSLSLSVLGAATSYQVTLGYNVATQALYTLAIYDLTGRILHSENIMAKTGEQQITVDGLNLVAGMYFAKMSNGNSSSVARMMVN